MHLDKRRPAARIASATRSLFCCFALAAAGCGGAGNSSTPTSPLLQATPNFVRLQSSAGDIVGGGQSYSYTKLNSRIDVLPNGNELSLSVLGDERWFGTFVTPSGANQLKAGTYTSRRYDDIHSKGGLEWIASSFCDFQDGSFTIDSVTYLAGSLAALDLRFEQRCNGATAALTGTVHWRADDPTAPPGPLNPMPGGLWQPPAGVMSAAGNVIYLQSDAGEPVLNGQSLTLPSDPNMSMIPNGSQVTLRASGYIGTFVAMYSLGKLQPGYYGNLRSVRFNNPARGGVSWSYQAVNPCVTRSGWFAVDKVTYVGDVMTALELRFEQHCSDAAPALRGAIRWTAPPR